MASPHWRASLYTCGYTAVIPLHELLHPCLLGVGHAGANAAKHGGVDLDGHRQIDPHQHLAGVEAAGFRRRHAGDGHDGTLSRHSGGIHPAGEGHGHLQLPHSLLSVGQVEHRGLDTAQDLHPALQHLLTPQAHGASGVADAQDVRAGVRDDHFHRFFVGNGGFQHSLIAAALGPLQFQFHSCSTPCTGPGGRFAVALYHNYMYKVRPL